MSESTESSIFDKTQTFASLGLANELCNALDAVHFKHPTHIQAKAIPEALKTPLQDIIGIAETGSGKTASFLLPICHHLLTSDKKPSPGSVLILTPTRELATQIETHAKAIANPIGLRTMVLTGGEDVAVQRFNIAKKKPHVVIGTVGRVSHLLREAPDFNLYRTRFLVLDEADHMLSPQFENDLHAILENNRMATTERITYLYTATMTKKVKKLAKLHFHGSKVQVIQCTSSKYATVSHLKQQYVLVPEKQKPMYLAYLLNEHAAGKRVIVFVNGNADAVRLAIILRSLGFVAAPLAGMMNENTRLSVLRRFAAGDCPILIATDVAGRGIDIPDVSMVINYEIPVYSKEYIHRCGRTARAGREGMALTFVTQYNIVYFKKIESLIGKRLDAFSVDKKAVQLLDHAVNRAVHLADEHMADPTLAKKAGTDNDATMHHALLAIQRKRKNPKDSNKRKHKKKKR